MLVFQHLSSPTVTKEAPCNDLGDIHGYVSLPKELMLLISEKYSSPASLKLKMPKPEIHSKHTGNVPQITTKQILEIVWSIWNQCTYVQGNFENHLRSSRADASPINEDMPIYFPCWMSLKRNVTSMTPNGKSKLCHP